MMSIGDCDSATVRSLTRVPVTMTVSSVLAWACAGAAVSGAASWARAGPPARMDSRASARVVGTGRGRMVVDAGQYSAGDGAQFQLSGDAGLRFGDDRGFVHVAGQVGDRKSTRLNSSH